MRPNDCAHVRAYYHHLLAQLVYVEGYVVKAQKQEHYRLYRRWIACW